MKKIILVFLNFSLVLYGQVINNFDVEPDTSFWDYETSASADSTLSYTEISYITDQINEGLGSMKVDYLSLIHI